MVPIPLIITLLIASLILCGLCCYNNYLKHHMTVSPLQKDIITAAIIAFDMIVLVLVFVTVGIYFDLL